MKKSICILLVILNLTNASYGFHVDNVSWRPGCNPRVGQDLPVQNFFKATKPTFHGYRIITEPLNLMQAAKDVLYCFQSHHPKNDSIISQHDVINTLQFIIDVIEQDATTGQFRILDPTFLEKNFCCMQWTADYKNAQKHNITIPRDGRIRLTSYGIWTVKGSDKKTADYPCGLYKLLDESIGKKYTKHQILAGVLEKPQNRKKRKALAWVCRQDLEDALMQGTVVVKFPNGSYKILNVHKTNGIAYNRHQKNTLAQARYWFFKEIASDAQEKKQAIDRFKQRRNVIFAGDLYHIGLGKLIAIRHQNPITKKCEMLLGILADTGGAFDNNLYQLDLFSGLFESRSALTSQLRKLPAATNACILYRK